MGGTATTLGNTGSKIANDNLEKCFAHGAYNLGAVEWVRELYTAMTPTPGMGLAPRAAASGEDYYITCPDKDPTLLAIAEFDPDQIADQTTSYAAGDEIPGLPLNLNIGAILQNIKCVDPGADVAPMSTLTQSSGTNGKFKPVTEATLITSAVDTSYKFQTATLGTNAAAGTFILQRAPLKQLYWLTDPNAVYSTIAMILGCI